MNQAGQGDIQFETVFNPESDCYLLMLLGRDQEQRRVHGCLIYIDIINNKIWIQCDGNEASVASELLNAWTLDNQQVSGSVKKCYHK